MKVRNEVLKEKLKKNSWSQNELAIRVGVARGTISRVMNNQVILRLRCTLLVRNTSYMSKSS